jgi:hypothetical protein
MYNKGDSQRRVGLYDMENDSYIDDPYTSYVWTGIYTIFYNIV